MNRCTYCGEHTECASSDALRRNERAQAVLVAALWQKLVDRLRDEIAELLRRDTRRR